MELCNQVNEKLLYDCIQDCHEKGRGSHTNEQIEPEAVGRIMDHLLPQFLVPVITLQKAEEWPSLLTAAEINVAVDRVYTKARKAPGPDGIFNSVLIIVLWANPRQSMQFSTRP